MDRVVNGVVVWSSGHVLAAIRGERSALDGAMKWDTTPHGWDYWESRHYGEVSLADDDRAFLRSLLTDKDRATWDAENAAAKRAADIAEAERAVIAAALAWGGSPDAAVAVRVLAIAVADLVALRGAA